MSWRNPTEHLVFLTTLTTKPRDDVSPFVILKPWKFSEGRADGQAGCGR